MNYKYPAHSTGGSTKNKYPQNPQPAGRKATAILFGRGMREDLDYDEAAELVQLMRAAVKDEWEAGSPTNPASKGPMVKDPTNSEAEANAEGGNGRRGGWKV